MSCPGPKGTQETQTKQLGGKSKKSKSIKKCLIKSLLQLLQRKSGAPSPTGRTQDFLSSLKTRDAVVDRHQFLPMVEYLSPSPTKNTLT